MTIRLPGGMIIDCIYTDPTENNARNSKPPLVCWAVNKIWEASADKAFLAEMYPQLLAYYKWWYDKRDHDRNGMCEYGATDGTLEAAAWESGMDNAIRFDDTKMLSNGSDDAWSMDRGERGSQRLSCQRMHVSQEVCRNPRREIRCPGPYCGA